MSGFGAAAGSRSTAAHCDVTFDPTIRRRFVSRLSGRFAAVQNSDSIASVFTASGVFEHFKQEFVWLQKVTGISKILKNPPEGWFPCMWRTIVTLGRVRCRLHRFIALCARPECGSAFKLSSLSNINRFSWQLNWSDAPSECGIVEGTINPLVVIIYSSFKTDSFGESFRSSYLCSGVGGCPNGLHGLNVPATERQQ